MTPLNTIEIRSDPFGVKDKQVTKTTHTSPSPRKKRAPPQPIKKKPDKFVSAMPKNAIKKEREEKQKKLLKEQLDSAAKSKTKK